MASVQKIVVFGVGGYWNAIRTFLVEGLKIVAYMDNYVKSQCGGNIFT